MVRENAFASAYKYIKEQNEAESQRYKQALEEAAKKHQDSINRIYDIRESRELKRREHIALIEDCKNDALSTIIKAIYIEALVPASLTDNALFLAESMVDGWIREKGGASRIISSCKNKSYLLNRICSIAEEVAEDNVKEIEADESEAKTLKEQNEEEEAKKEKVTQMLAQANALIAKATAIQNGDESVLNDEKDNKEGTEEAPAEDSGAEETEDTMDASEPVEDETEETESSSDDDNGDPDFGDIPDEKEEKTEEVESEEKEAEKDVEEAEEDQEEAETKEEESEEKVEDAETEVEDAEEDTEEAEEDQEESDEDNEFVEDDDEGPEVDDSLSDPDMGDIDNGEEGEDEDQQDAEAELTGDSMDDEDVENEDEDEVDSTSVDGENSEPQGKIFDELDKEEDVQKAVQLIQQRVADAEEDFIKRNAEDKKKIDDLLGKISDNIKTVEAIADNDSPKSKIAQENTQMLKRQIKNITENRPQSVFERMARKLTESVTKDSDLRAIYLAESGRTDIASVIESTKVMYGFLEALRTLQLEKVDEEYIANVLKNM